METSINGRENSLWKESPEIEHTSKKQGIVYDTLTGISAYRVTKSNSFLQNIYN